ncbi:ABC transporter substrate-binding protein [Citrobacter sp. C348]|uniref:ABC transporter substrate-binding protein n=1 Tax=Citrobacter sp. C348 TaxID=3048143 RepID=UPI0015F3F22A|nr:ABC transporter substrate-binding protein [Citrobacter freundii]
MKTCHTWLLCVWLAFPVLAARQVVDDAGQTVSVPNHVQRIADSWFAHHSVLMTLGAGSQIVATVNHAQSQPWMFKINPSLNQAVQIRGTSFNSEALLALNTDVLFVAKGKGDAQSYRQAGIPTLEMAFTDYPSMEKSVTATAQALGTEQARTRAVAYNQYLQRVLHRVGTQTAGLTESQRPRVLHIQSLNPLKVDGSSTLIDTWITLSGGRNAAGEIVGNMKEVSPEKVLYWQPEIIILGAGCGDIASSPYAALFNELNAVKNGRVWRNPAGVFPWDRYGTESALQLQWAASKLHPTRFPGLDMVSITREFYRQFFDYSLSQQDAMRILKALPPE